MLRIGLGGESRIEGFDQDAQEKNVVLIVYLLRHGITLIIGVLFRCDEALCAD